MKIFNKSSILIILAISFLLTMAGPMSASAAGVAPNLGLAATYAVFGKTGVTNDAGGVTHVWGNVGADGLGTITNLIASQVGGTIIAPAAGVQTAITAAYAELDNAGIQGAPTAISLAGNPTVTPGVYSVLATETLDGTVTLNGAGVYIFRSDSAFTVGSNAHILLTNGATACNVFWQIPSSMTIGAGAEMVGTIIADTGLISLGSGATLKGRALSSTKQVTMLINQITEPTCVVAASSSRGDNTITIIKQIINDNGGTATSFPLFINGNPVVSGQSVSLEPGTYTITETGLANYKATFSGDCDVNGRVNHGGIDTHNDVCILTNNDIGAPVAVAPVPPLIDVVKVPSPLALPSGPGLVNYTYTLRNIGTVPVTDITMVGDTCSPITLTTGDTDNDAKLDLNETWVYKCATTLNETHTNTVVATGWANGLSAVDIASATVVVGEPIVPPLIHITKVPNPLALAAGGGTVTYTKKVTNPGTVALSNVRVADDKCSPIKYISGDINKDLKLDPTETWTYTCKATLTKTTTNTAVASGEANGLTVRDFAIATVVVATAVPKLPNTGVATTGGISGNIALLAGALLLVAAASFMILRKRSQRTND